MSVPVLLEIGREAVGPKARDDLLREAAQSLMAELGAEQGTELGDGHGHAGAEAGEAG